jgi:CRP-like cAMP-binding protein
MHAATDRLDLFLKEIPFLKGISNADAQEFLKLAHIKKYTKSQVVFLHGDAADRFFIIISGWVKLHRETPEGDESVISLLTRGDIFGEAAIFSNAQYPFSAYTAEEAQLIEIPSSFLKEKAKSNPGITANIMESMSDEIGRLQLEKEHITLMSTPQRVGCLLLQLSSGVVGKGGAFSFPYDKSLAATRLGMKAETFSRALAQLKPLGVSVKGSEIEIDSFECLVDYSCGHCSATPENCKKSEYCSQDCTKKNLGTH